MAEPANSYIYATREGDRIGHKLAKRVSQDLGINLVIVYYPTHAAKLAAVESGEADFTSNVIYTKERAERFIFSAPTNVEYTYFFSPQELDYKNVTRVGVPYGTVLGDIVLQFFPEMNIVEYDSIVQAKHLIESNQVDGVVDSLFELKFMVLAGMNADLVSFKYPIKPVSLVTAKEENREILKKIEQYVYQEDIQSYITQQAEAHQFEIKRQALRKRVLLSDVDVNQPLKVKIESFNEFGSDWVNGNLQNIAADVVFESCRLMRVECELVGDESESWASMLNSLLNEEIDILAPFALTKERYKLAHISKKFFQPEVIVIKRKGYKENVYRSISELVAERVGVVEGRVYENVVRRRLPHKPLVVFEHAQEQLNALLNNEVDYIVMTRTTYHQLLRDTRTILPIVEDDMIGAFYSYNAGIGFQRNSQGQTLSRLFSEAIDLLDLDTIINKYDYAPDWQTTLIKQTVFTEKSQQLLITIVIALMITSYLWHKQSVTDSLTKLKNRLALYKNHKHGLYKGQMLIYFDINKFKSINDTYGHLTGDRVLQTIAKNINSFWKYQSYRIGGDEFVLIGYPPEGEVSKCLAKIGFFEFDNGESKPFEVKISYGSYLSNGENLSLDDCLHLADTEMYKHKDS